MLLLLIGLWIIVLIAYTVTFIKKNELGDFSFVPVLMVVSMFLLFPVVIITLAYIPGCYEIEFLNKLYNTSYTWDEWFFNKEIISQLLKI